jgi:hypothetical protein
MRGAGVIWDIDGSKLSPRLTCREDMVLLSQKTIFLTKHPLQRL